MSDASLPEGALDKVTDDLSDEALNRKFFEQVDDDIDASSSCEDGVCDGSGEYEDNEGDMRRCLSCKPDPEDPLPCPFCGKTAKLNTGDFGEKFFTCSDDNCGGRLGTGIWFPTDEQAIEVWNRRAPIATVEAPQPIPHTSSGQITLKHGGDQL